MKNVTIETNQQIAVLLKPIDDRSNPASLDGKPTWTKQSGDAVLEVADDGLSAKVTAGAPGDTVILIDGDADLGAGVVDVQDVVTVTVTPRLAKNLGVEFGAPVDL